jgi:cardiolipin synthase
MHHDYLHAIRLSKKSISIMNAYFIPDRGLRRQFRNAARRGVSVRAMLPSISDVPLVQYASRYLYARLLRHGMRIFEWPEKMMHSKIGVIDGVWSTIGSYNLDARSFLHNLEVGLVIVDRDFGAQLDNAFDGDVQRCREIVLDEWQERSSRERVLEWLAYRFRYWL